MWQIIRDYYKNSLFICILANGSEIFNSSQANAFVDDVVSKFTKQYSFKLEPIVIEDGSLNFTVNIGGQEYNSKWKIQIIAHFFLNYLA